MKNLPAILEKTALEILPGEPSQFFFGDNLEGYYEGRALQTAAGSGYWLDGRPVFLDFAARAGNRPLPRENARRALLLPHAVRHVHPGAFDELSILRRRRAIALRVRADAPARLGASLFFDPGVGAVSLEARGDAFVASFASCPLRAGIACSAPADPCPPDPAGGNRPAAAFLARRPARDFVLYVAFHPSPDRAAQLARDLLAADALAAHRAEIADVLSRSSVRTGIPDLDLALAWAKLSSVFLVAEEFGKGIWAGLPWFKNNWGRDTFIALPGTLLVSGLFDDARDVVLNFLRYQDQNPSSPTYGRVPNRVCSPSDVIYNTADGTPWLVRELFEYLQYTGDVSLARDAFPQIRLALDAALERETDSEGFLCHGDADTWMDARIEGNLPWSARGNRANDVQALWHNALLCGERLALLADDPAAAQRWRAAADRLRLHFLRRFWNPRAKRLADRLDPAGRRDEKVRPNQLMVVSVPMVEPLLDEEKTLRVVENAASELLFPHGIASLSPLHPYFHPVHHDDPMHHFDAAYHNGTVWGWNAGFATTALCRARQTELAAKLARNLAGQILRLGCRGAMSELVEAIPRKRGQLVLSGTWAQAWSSSEFSRNAHQDFVGFHPRLLDGLVLLRPHLPRAWNRLDARLPCAAGAALLLRFRRQGRRARFSFEISGHPAPLELDFQAELGNRLFSFRATLEPGRPLSFAVDGPRGRLGRRTPVDGVPLPKIKPLRFANPVLEKSPPSRRHPHYLQKIVESGQFR